MDAGVARLGIPVYNDFDISFPSFFSAYAATPVHRYNP